MRAARRRALHPQRVTARAPTFPGVQKRGPSDEGRGCIGVPGMVALFAFCAFAGTIGGLKGFLIAIAAMAIIYLIGAVVWAGKRRSDT